MCQARAVMHVGIANPQWQGKRSQQPTILRIWQEAHSSQECLLLGGQAFVHLGPGRLRHFDKTVPLFQLAPLRAMLLMLPD